jgi:hypothetical protein
VLRTTSEGGWYEPLEWVLVRSPLLPLDLYLELGEDGSDPQALPTAVHDPRVRRAISVASPALFERLDSEPSSAGARRRRRLGALRYLVRMSTRPTPYGVNAGVSLARWGQQTNLELTGTDVLRARLDMGLLSALIAASRCCVPSSTGPSPVRGGTAGGTPRCPRRPTRPGDGTPLGLYEGLAGLGFSAGRLAAGRPRYAALLGSL